MPLFEKNAAPKMFTLIAGLLFVAWLASPAPALSQSSTVMATIDTTKTGTPISKYIYGQFLEHGGDIVNTGVWSELLVDRKFYYPVASSAPKPPPVMGNAAGNPRFNRTPTRWWSPIGGEVVTMDTKAPYTGEQTPLVKLDASEPHGLKQSGITVRKGKSYTGRIVLAGSPGSVVKVTLIGARSLPIARRLLLGLLAPAFTNFRSTTLQQPTVTMQASRSPGLALDPSMSGRSHSCPPTTSRAFAPRWLPH